MSLELRNVSAAYGSRQALSGVDLAASNGDAIAVIGPSGSGKSTLLRLLAGLEAPTAGEVWIDGRRASAPGEVSLPPHRRRVGMVFQDLALWPNLTALENVTLGLPRRGRERRTAAAAGRRALAWCGIEDLAGRRPGTLSGGEQQRVALARALAAEPAHLLFDEPFAGLDLATKDKLLLEIGTLARERSLTVLLVTHDPFEASMLCRAALALEAGRVVESGPWSQVLAAPRSAILRRFAEHLRATRGSGLP